MKIKIDKVYLSLTIVVFFAALSWVFSCRHDPLLPSTIPEICFEKEILPIFQNNCSMAGCHDGTGESGSFNNYIDISHGVVVGNPNASRLYQAIIGKSGEVRMPPDKPLSLEKRMIIRLWIEQGAQLTVCPDTTSQTPGYVNPRACFSRDILPILISSCAMTGCHDAATHQHGYVFASYSTTRPTVVPGNPGASQLYRSVTLSSGEDDIMPPPPKSHLSAAAIDSIAAWIRYGALDEYCGEICDTINPVTFSGVIWPVIQASCTGCHSGASPSGGIALNNYSDVQTIASNGLLINALKGNGVPKMPPAGSFSLCRIRQFEIWINNGFPDN